MPVPALPRYFIADAAPPRPLPVAANAAIAEVVDLFVMGDGRAPHTCAVVRDLGGSLLACSEAIALQDATLQRSLIHAEIARGGPPRYLNASEVWLFAPQLAELSEGGDPYGAPIRLFGALHGPFGGDTLGAMAVEGHLTVRRGDWLLGLVRGCTQGFGVVESADSFISHALLPGADHGNTANGAGTVLAYPLLPVVAADGGGNAVVVCQLLTDLLNNLQAACKAVGADGPFVSELIPVADRSEIEARLTLQGFVITGDTAAKDRMFGRDDRIDLPALATMATVLPCARRALNALESLGFPDAWARAVHSRVSARAPTPLPPPRIHATAPAHYPALAAKAKPAKTVKPSPRPPEWMADFADLPPAQPQAKIAPRTVQERAAQPARPANPRRVPPQVPQPTPASRSPTNPEPPQQPDWMKDFE
ncbi:MAG: hypothetical protein EXR77_10965 [Myxococcales bacterium]|nr:hypothetical protein [Myxococcales bacterium]